MTVRKLCQNCFKRNKS